MFAVGSFFLGFSITILQFLQDNCDWFIVLKAILGTFISHGFDFINRILFVIISSLITLLRKHQTFYSRIS